MENYTPRKFYEPYVSPFDPCPPLKVKSYETPPHLYISYQPYGLPQYAPKEALYAGTIWPAFYNPYFSPYKKHERQGDE